MSRLNLSIIQAPLHWENKELNLAYFQQAIAELNGAQLVLLPETFNTGFCMNTQVAESVQNSPTLKWMQEMAVTYKVAIAGSFYVKDEDKFFNRLYLVLPNGSYGKYDKRHLFSYAGEGELFSKGHSRFIATLNGITCNFQICYDLRFPVWARQEMQQQQQAEYDVLINIANWPQKRIDVWKKLLMARAIENQCYVVGVNRIGVDGLGEVYDGQSCIVDASGSVLYEADSKETSYTYTIDSEPLHAYRNKFPFLADADTFSINL